MVARKEGAAVCEAGKVARSRMQASGGGGSTYSRQGTSCGMRSHKKKGPDVQDKVSSFLVLFLSILRYIYYTYYKNDSL
jgi:hypothetical protein